MSDLWKTLLAHCHQHRSVYHNTTHESTPLLRTKHCVKVGSGFNLNNEDATVRSQDNREHCKYLNHLSFGLSPGFTLPTLHTFLPSRWHVTIAAYDVAALSLCKYTAHKWTSENETTRQGHLMTDMGQLHLDEVGSASWDLSSVKRRLSDGEENIGPFKGSRVLLVINKVWRSY